MSWVCEVREVRENSVCVAWTRENELYSHGKGVPELLKVLWKLTYLALTFNCSIGTRLFIEEPFELWARLGTCQLVK